MTTPVTPAVTMPTLAQVMHMSRQAAKLSGHASQRVNLVNQTMGQLQQLASLGQGAAARTTPEEVSCRIFSIPIPRPRSHAGTMPGGTNPLCASPQFK